MKVELHLQIVTQKFVESRSRDSLRLALSWVILASSLIFFGLSWIRSTKIRLRVQLG